MLIEYRSLPETARTVGTCVGLFVSMDSQVLCQVGLLAEAFSALGAAVGSGIGVDTLMLKEGAFLLEVFAAGETLEESQVGCLGFGVRSW